MKGFKNTCLLGVVGALALAVATASANDKTTSRALANHELTSLDGKKTTLSSFKGDVLVVNFWASWCAPCRKELPVMNEWHASWSERGARVVAISIDKDVRKARRFAEKAKLAMTVLHDDSNDLAAALDLPSLPCTYLLDGNGNVVSITRGSSEKALAELHGRVETLLAKSRKSAATKVGVRSRDRGGSDDGGSP